MRTPGGSANHVNTKDPTMKKSKNSSADAAELRRKAEEQLRKQKTKKARPGTELDAQRLLHELQVHQIELEMQNEEL